MYAVMANAIGKNSLATTPVSIEDPIRMVQRNLSAVGRSDSEVLVGRTFIMQAGTTASEVGTTGVCADFPTDNSAAATGNQTAIIPANRGCENQSI